MSVWDKYPRSLSRSALPLGAKALYPLLRSFDGPRGCFPSQETIWTHLQCSKASLNRYLDALEAAGFIERRRGWITAGERRVQICLYTFPEVSSVRPHSDSEVSPVRPQGGEVSSVRPQTGSEVSNETHLKSHQRPSNEIVLTRYKTCATGVAQASDFALEPEKPKATEPPPQKGKLQAAQDTWFTAFWASVWRKRGKAQARKAFLKLVRSEDDFRLVIAARDRDLPEFLEREEQFRPHPATWLNGEDWREAPEPEPAVPTLEEQLRRARETDSKFDWGAAS